MGRIRKKLSTIAIVALAASLIGTLVYAQWFMNRPVGFTGTVQAINNIQVYSDSGCTNVLSSVSYGNLYRGNVTFTTFWIKNIGDAAVSIEYNITGLPTGITFTMAEYLSGGSMWGPNNSELHFTEPVPSGTAFECNLTVTIGGSAAIGAFGFTLNVYATA